jgi:UDP:flavonoid glycosyltransferase YjiC (YdhE family)
MNSANEALHHGVPMVAMPVFGDQPLVAERLAELGVARRVDFVKADPKQGPRGLKPGPVDAGALARSVDELLASPAVASASAELAESFRAAPGIRRALEVVHELTQSGTRR